MNNNITSFAANDQAVSPAAQCSASNLQTRPSAKRRHATLTLVLCRKTRENKELGSAFGGRLECEGHTVWLEDAIALGVIAYVLNIGTVELRLPTFRDRTSKLYAHQLQLPSDVIDLYNGLSKSLLKRQNEAAEALFVRRFATGLRVCTQSKTQVPSLVDWYRMKKLPPAVNAVPADLNIDERI
jgi:hypothetical protein